ncbi:hypothetical protein pb186bvf_006012 [Paramecium bursaria]
MQERRRKPSKNFDDSEVPYPQNRDQGDVILGRWTQEEHQRFVEALSVHGKNWKKVEEYVGSRSGAQIRFLSILIQRSHAQKFFNRLEKEFKQQFNGLKSSEIKTIFENKCFHKYYDDQKRKNSLSEEEIDPQIDQQKESDNQRVIQFQEAYGSIDDQKPKQDESFFQFIINKHRTFFDQNNQLQLSHFVDGPPLEKEAEDSIEQPKSRKQSFTFYNEQDEDNEQKYIGLKKVKKD